MARGKLAVACFIMVACVLLYAGAAHAGPPPALGARLLQPGSSGEDVRELQRRLVAAGFTPGKVDGLFGPRTRKAVIAFQKASRLAPDGVVGPATVAALAQAKAPGASSPGGQTAGSQVAGRGVHVVRRGETLQAIAAAYGISLRSLVEANALVNPNLILAGQRLLIPDAGGSPASSGMLANKNRAAPVSPAPGVAAPAKEGGGKVAITFNDGPDPLWTPEILAILRRHGVRASFFFVGERTEMYPEIAARAAAEGHELGNHTYSHADLTALETDEVTREVARAAAAIERAARVRPVFLRPPYGACDRRVDEIVQASGHRVVLWTNVTVRDWLAESPETLASQLAAVAFDGAVLMLHDTRELTVRALPLLLAQLEQAGLQPVAAGDLERYSSASR